MYFYGFLRFIKNDKQSKKHLGKINFQVGGDLEDGYKI